MLFHVFAHINRRHGVCIVEKEFSERLGEMRFTDTRGSHEKERAERSIRITESDAGRAFEVTPEGDLVCEYISPYANETYLGETVNWIFRAFRYAEDSPEIGGRLKL